MKRTRGFTLVEMVLNLTVVTLLMGILSSAILIAGRALPDPKSPQQASARAYEAAEQIAAELFGTVTFVQRTGRTVEFTVADRNTDCIAKCYAESGCDADRYTTCRANCDAGSVPETIFYEWSGTPGDPLTRQYNGGAKTPVVSDVHQFTLSYRTEAGTEKSPSTPTESAEILLVSQDTAKDLQNAAITKKGWFGQYFAPTLPAEAISWKVTQVGFKARGNGLPLGVTSVELRAPDANDAPGADVLARDSMSELGLLILYQWKQFSFEAVPAQKPGSGLCLVLGVEQLDTVLADVQYDNGLGSGFLSSTDAGANWNVSKSASLIYKVYGTYKSMTTPPPTTRTFITLVGISLQIGSDSASRVETTVQILNRPEVPLLQIVELDVSQL